jgi:hypothetical protein
VVTKSEQLNVVADHLGVIKQKGWPQLPHRYSA